MAIAKQIKPSRPLRMRIGNTFSCWHFAFAISLFFITIISLYTVNPPTTTPSISSTVISISNVLRKVAVDAEDYLLSLLVTRRSRGFNHCDDEIDNWKLQTISRYRDRVSLVLTVDLKGCANFSSIQEAVDAVPEFSPSKTLIVIDSATYRYLADTLANYN